jgi:hypothetical protein
MWGDFTFVKYFSRERELPAQANRFSGVLLDFIREGFVSNISRDISYAE